MNNDNDRNPHTEIAMIADFEGDEESLFDTKICDGIMRLLPLRGIVLMPGVVTPVTLNKPETIRIVEEAAKTHEIIGTIFKKDSMNKSMPYSGLTMEHVYSTGILVRVLRTLELPDKTFTAILQGANRFELQDMMFDRARREYFGNISILPESGLKENSERLEITVQSLRDMVDKFLDSQEHKGEVAFAIKNIANNMFFINFCSQNLPFTVEEKILLLKKNNLRQRAEQLIRLMGPVLRKAELRKKIQLLTQESMNQQQKEYFLHQEIRTIQEELGITSDDEIEEMREQALKKDWPKNVCDTFLKELNRLMRIQQQSPDYNVQFNYLQAMLSLPWNVCTKDNLSINNAKKVLDADHFGMEKVKERILEHLAVIRMRGDMKSPILCLYGPPGVGKTSLGRSIAKALGRQYVRVSLGGLHDESEIRGHRRTYIGAMPGRIIKNIQKAGSSNPVFVLDEIDKVTQHTINGDPASALLEVLDPEQNSTFHDNFLDTDYDLSKVMFIATANDLNTIPKALLDRMELIEVPGYVTEEKVEIAKRHLIPRLCKDMGFEGNDSVKIAKDAIEGVISKYTRESGVRQLEKTLAKLLRKEAMEFAINGKFKPQTIKAKDLKDMLGIEKVSKDKYEGNDFAGVVTGLAWTSVGGEILFIEVSLSRSKNPKLTLTGSLGDVMKESAIIALEYIKAHAEKYSIDRRILERYDIHIHVPDGATPKDGPSAGITLSTALISALTQRKVRAHLAMTGEITLRGRVTAVGGIREKMLAAKRAGIKDIILSKENIPHIEEIPSKYLEGLTFHYVSTIDEAISFALLEEKVKDALEFDLKEEETDKK